MPRLSLLLPLAMVALAGNAASRPGSPEPAARLATVAWRVHRMDAMKAFYGEAFGARFRTVDTGGLASQFAEIGGVTIKFVPIRDAADFENFPIHQPGFDVDDIERVIAIALRHGGRIQDPLRRSAAGRHAAVRDPDGNTVELYSKHH